MNATYTVDDLAKIFELPELESFIATPKWQDRKNVFYLAAEGVSGRKIETPADYVDAAMEVGRAPQGCDNQYPLLQVELMQEADAKKDYWFKIVVTAAQAQSPTSEPLEAFITFERAQEGGGVFELAAIKSFNDSTRIFSRRKFDMRIEDILMSLKETGTDGGLKPLPFHEWPTENVTIDQQRELVSAFGKIISSVKNVTDTTLVQKLFAGRGFTFQEARINKLGIDAIHDWREYFQGKPSLIGSLACEARRRQQGRQDVPPIK